MESQSSQAHVDLVYHGPDVDAGSMEVRDLAPAMLALASLIEATATEANGDRAQIKINLTSTLNRLIPPRIGDPQYHWHPRCHRLRVLCE